MRVMSEALAGAEVLKSGVGVAASFWLWNLLSLTGISFVL